jgi:hypothetical protein
VKTTVLLLCGALCVLLAACNTNGDFTPTIPSVSGSHSGYVYLLGATTSDTLASLQTRVFFTQNGSNVAGTWILITPQGDTLSGAIQNGQFSIQGAFVKLTGSLVETNGTCTGHLDLLDATVIFSGNTPVPYAVSGGVSGSSTCLFPNLPLHGSFVIFTLPGFTPF